MWVEILIYTIISLLSLTVTSDSLHVNGRLVDSVATVVNGVKQLSLKQLSILEFKNPSMKS